MAQHDLACPVCSKRFTSRAWYRKHIEGSVCTKQRTCPQCLRMFENASNMNRHQSKGQCSANVMVWDCPNCARKCRTKRILTRHMQACASVTVEEKETPAIAYVEGMDAVLPRYTLTNLMPHNALARDLGIIDLNNTRLYRFCCMHDDVKPILDAQHEPPYTARHCVQDIIAIVKAAYRNPKYTRSQCVFIPHERAYEGYVWDGSAWGRHTAAEAIRIALQAVVSDCEECMFSTDHATIREMVAISNGTSTLSKPVLDELHRRIASALSFESIVRDTSRLVEVRSYTRDSARRAEPNIYKIMFELEEAQQTIAKLIELGLQISDITKERVAAAIAKQAAGV